MLPGLRPQPRTKLLMLSAFHFLVLLILSLPARSQKLSMDTLARCGWAGSGLSSRWSPGFPELLDEGRAFLFSLSLSTFLFTVSPFFFASGTFWKRFSNIFVENNLLAKEIQVRMMEKRGAPACYRSR